MAWGINPTMSRSTRASVSLRGITYEFLKAKAEERGVSASGLVEILFTEELDALGVPRETVLRPGPVPRVTDSSRFTF